MVQVGSTGLIGGPGVMHATYWKWSMLVLLIVAVPAVAQTMYKCTVNGKVGYSDRPCPGNSEQRAIRTDAGPTISDQIRAQERIEHLRSHEQAQERQREAATVRQVEPIGQSVGPAQIDRANEKMMVHGSSGWDMKTRGQVAAEAAAKERGQARAQGQNVPEPLASGQDWEKEKVLTHSTSGWDRKTRAEAVAAEGAMAEKRERGRIAAEQNRRQRETTQGVGSSTVSSCDRSGCWDTAGNRYNGSGSTLFRSDGKVCTRSGSALMCN